MTKQKKPDNARQYYAAFKSETVYLWQSGWGLAEKTARELGISPYQLDKWKP